MFLIGPLFSNSNAQPLSIAPRLNVKTGLLEPTKVDLTKNPLHSLGRLMIETLAALGLARVERDPATGALTSVNNLTLINLVLVRLGPMRERNVTIVVMLLQ